MNKEFIRSLTELVEANLANETFGSEELARGIGMSHSRLLRKLKIISNKNINQFIREIRLNKAKELLLTEDLTVAEISFRVGFGSPTYFNKCFHEYFGHAPGELRIMEQEGKTDEAKIVPQPEKRKRPKILIVLIICSIFLIPLSYFLITRFQVSNAANLKQKSIAILPFKYLSDEPDKQYLADGMMDAILLHLSKIKDLRVISRTSVEQYRRSDKSAKVIGKELGAAYLLEGSFQKDGDQIRLILQLIKTSDQDHVWSNEYDRYWEDIFSVQSEVAETIADELDAIITPEAGQLIRKVPTTNLTAYDFYQRGRDELDKRDDSIAWEKAQKLFKRALELDSTFALAYTGLADIYWSKHYWETFLSENFLDSVILLTSKSISYDNQCAEAYYLRGAAYFQTNKPSEAFKELEKAIRFNPNNWKAYQLKSFLLGDVFQDFVGAISNRNEAILRNRGIGLPNLLSDMGTSFIDIGFPELGKQYFRQALELDGDSSRYMKCLRYSELWAGNFENAYELARNAYKRDSNSVTDMNTYCIMTGRNKEAYYHFQKLAKRLKKSGEVHPWASQGIGYTYWLEGRTKEAKFYFDQQIKISMESIKLNRQNAIQKQAQWDLAKVYAFTGDKEKAYYYLDEVNKNHAFPLWWVTLFEHDPLLASIRSEVRFKKIQDEVEAKYLAEHERVKKWLVSQGML